MVLKNKDASLSKNVSSAVEKIRAILRYSQKGNADLLADRVYFGGNFNDKKTSNNLMQIQSAIIHFRVILPSFRSTSLTIGALIFIGFAIGRVFSISVDGKPNSKINQGIIFELVLGGANVFALLSGIVL